LDRAGEILLRRQFGGAHQHRRIDLLSKPAPSAKQIAEAEYDPTNEQVHVIFQDGTTEQVKL